MYDNKIESTVDEIVTLEAIESSECSYCDDMEKHHEKRNTARTSVQKVTNH